MPLCAAAFRFADFSSISVVATAVRASDEHEYLASLEEFAVACVCVKSLNQSMKCLQKSPIDLRFCPVGTCAIVCDLV